MTQVRFGLQARFLLVMALTLLLVGAILASLLQRQSAMQREVRGLSAQILHELFDRSLRTRGETLATELASGLANPCITRIWARWGRWCAMLRASRW